MKRLLIPLLLGFALFLARTSALDDHQPDRGVAALHDGSGHAPILQVAPAPALDQAAELELVTWGWPSSDAPGALLALEQLAETPPDPVDVPIADAWAATYLVDRHLARPISAGAWPNPRAPARQRT